MPRDKSSLLFSTILKLLRCFETRYNKILAVGNKKKKQEERYCTRRASNRTYPDISTKIHVIEHLLCIEKFIFTKRIFLSLLSSGLSYTFIILRRERFILENKYPVARNTLFVFLNGYVRWSNTHTRLYEKRRNVCIV